VGGIVYPIGIANRPWQDLPLEDPPLRAAADACRRLRVESDSQEQGSRGGRQIAPSPAKLKTRHRDLFADLNDGPYGGLGLTGGE
jgi:hypothetical protein